MSNSLQTTSPGELPALARSVPMTASLAYHVAGDAVIDGHYSAAVGTPSVADVAEAKRRLQEAQHLCRQPTDGLIMVWCANALLETLPKAPTTDEAMAATLSAVISACSDLPAAVFTAETAKLALQKFKWWPGPAEVYELLFEHAKPFQRALAGLERVVAMGEPTAPAEREEVTPEAQEHVHQLVEAFKRERSWNREGAKLNERTPVKPRYLSDEQLAMEYKKVGIRNPRETEGAR